MYLLGKRVGWREVAVPLAVDGRLSAPSDGVHLPVGVVVVHNVKVTMPAPETTAIDFDRVSTFEM